MLDATYGGYIEADNVKITTLGGSCATLATDRGEGTINNNNIYTDISAIDLTKMTKQENNNKMTEKMPIKDNTLNMEENKSSFLPYTQAGKIILIMLIIIGIAIIIIPIVNIYKKK